MQWERRREPYPWSWEIAAGVLLVTLGLVVTSTQIGRALANVLAGGPWLLPPLTSWAASTLPVLGGDAAAGLGGQPGHLTSRDLLWIWVVGVHILTVTAATGAGIAAWRRWGNSRIRGLASRAEVARLLTRHRLHKVKAVIRPDLYGQTPKRRRFRPRRKSGVGWR